MKTIILSPNNNLNSIEDIIVDQLPSDVVNDIMSNCFYFNTIDEKSFKLLHEIFKNETDIIVKITSNKSINLLRIINDISMYYKKQYSISF